MEATRNDVRPHPVMGAVDLGLSLLMVGGIWVGLPARWWPLDLFGTLVALMLAAAGVGLLARQAWAERAALTAGIVTLVGGAGLLTALAFTASYLSGLYGPVGQGGAVILFTVLLLLLPYLVVLPATQVYILVRQRRP